MKALFWLTTLPFHISVILFMITNPNAIFWSYVVYFVGWLVFWWKQARKDTSRISFLMLWVAVGIIFLSCLIQGFSIGAWLFR
jgi:hypothetical protein